MLDVCLLGTSGMMPLPKRWLTALMTRYNGSSLLIDCGEGTQIAIKNKGWSFNPIDIICFTHFHADHISGLTGMLLLMGNQGKTTPLTIIGPKGTQKVVDSLRVIAPVLPYEINYKEIVTPYTNWRLNELNIHTFNELTISAFKVNHKVNCYGYTFELSRLPKFNPEKAQELGIEKRYWGKLQHGESVEVNNKLYTPNMVLGEPRKGLKIAYCTDTRPCESIIYNTVNSDLFICEAMYGDKDKKPDAIDKKHLMMDEAAQIAKAVNVKELWLTHFSPSMPHPEMYLKDTKKIFKNTIIPKDGQHKKLKFEKE